MNDRSFRRLAVAIGLTAGAVIGGPLAVGASPGSGTAPPAPSLDTARSLSGGEPDRVSGISTLLDAMEVGSTVTPGIANGVAATVVGSQQLPPPGDQVQAALLQALGTIGQEVVRQGPEAVGQLREALASLACANDGLNTGIEGLAAALERGATDFGKAIQPFDLTAQELAALLRGTQEDRPATC